MDKNFFQKIENSKYADFISFALWSDSDISDLSVIKNSIEFLNQNIIIIGLNVSREVQRFQNFHFRHRGGRDHWLREAFNKGIFRGAYMTDIIKNDVSPRQSSVDLSKENINKNLLLFKEELDFINSKNIFIIAIGDTTYNILKEHLSKDGINICSIPHYARRGITREEFIESVEKCEIFFKSIRSVTGVL